MAGDDGRPSRAGPRASGVPAGHGVLAGTCSAPAAVTPSWISLVRTPIAGITSAVGRRHRTASAGGTAA